jgi:hypothetical protein
MRKSLILAVSLGTMLLSSTAFAAAMDAIGVIKSINWKHHAITLSNGRTYDLPAHFAMKNLKKGEKVSIAYVVRHKQFIATSVKAV